MTEREAAARPPLALWLGLGLAVVAARLAVIAWLRTWQGDAGLYEHDAIARSLVAGDGFRYAFFADAPHPSGHQAPALPMLLAAGYAVLGVGSGAAIAAVQGVLALLHGAGAMALGRVAWSWWGRRGLVVAMLLFLLHPAFAYAPTRVQTVNWSLAFVLLLLAGVVAIAEGRGGKCTAVATGLAAGLGVLGEPILLAPLGLCVVLLVWQGGAARRAGLVLAGVAGLTLVPWSLRNAVVLGAPGVKSSLAYVVWQGNHRGASGTDKLPVEPATARDLAWRVGGSELEATLADARAQAVSVDVHLSAADSAAIRALPTERARMAWFKARAKADVLADPAEYLRVSARRAWMLAWFDDTNPRAFVLPYRLPWVLLALAALFGAQAFWRAATPEGRRLWLAVVGGLVAVHVLVIMSARFRLPLEALVMLPATAALLRVVPGRGPAR